jgi:hypothetical protein
MVKIFIVYEIRLLEKQEKFISKTKKVVISILVYWYKTIKKIRYNNKFMRER